MVLDWRVLGSQTPNHIHLAERGGTLLATPAHMLWSLLIIPGDRICALPLSPPNKGGTNHFH